MEQSEELKIPHYVEKAMKRLTGETVLVSQCSASEEAEEKGDGHVYFTHPDGKKFPTASAVFLIRESLVKPVGDDLFDGGSQTYRAA